jgi:ParB family transcriptional regulator, chromosome partitioning protein
MKKKVLGRGLEALIPEGKQAETLPNEIDIDRILLNPKQPRLVLDEARLEELAASICENGILQPVLVRPFQKGYQLIAGERRLSAAQRAGLLKIPAMIREVPDEKLLELALIENIQREPLNPIEEAQAYQRLIDTTNETQEQISGRLGKDRSTVANSIRLLKLPQSIKLVVAEGKLSPGHARALLAANANPSELERMAALIIDKGWSVRETERWAKGREKTPQTPKIQDPNEAAASDRLRIILGTKVEILSKSKNSGEIRIHYYSQEDLMRLYAILAEKTIPTEPKHAIREKESSR